MDRLTNKYRKMQIEQLLELKKQNDARKAKVSHIGHRNNIMQYQEKANYQNEYNRIRAHLVSKVIPDATKVHLESRKKQIDDIFNFL